MCDCGILVPVLGTEPASSALQGEFLITGPQGSPFFFYGSFLHLFIFLFNRHLGCFHILAFTNNAVMNIVSAYIFSNDHFYILQVYSPKWNSWIIC